MNSIQRNFFQQSPPDTYLAMWQQQLAQEQHQIAINNSGMMILNIGHERLAWPAKASLEVIPTYAIHTIPHRNNPILKGVTAIMGRLIPCLSLNLLLELEEPTTQPQQLMLAGDPEEPWGILVDHIESYARFHSDHLEPMPATLAQSSHCFSQGMIAWHEHSLPLLDETLVFSAFERCLV